MSKKLLRLLKAIWSLIISNIGLFILVFLIFYGSFAYLLRNLNKDYLSLLSTILTQVITIAMFILAEPKNRDQELALGLLPSLLTLPLLLLIKVFQNEFSYTFLNYMNNILIPTLGTSFMAMYNKNEGFWKNLCQFPVNIFKGNKK